MATKKELVSDIILRLTKGKPSDDFEIDDRQVGFQLDVIRAALIKAKVEAEADIDLSDFVTFFEAVDVFQRDKKADDGGDSSFYLSNLPSAVLSLPNDAGVMSIETQGGTEVTRMKPSDRIRFKHLRFGRPTSCRPAYHRVKDEIYYDGGTDNWRNNGVCNMYLILETITDEEGDYPLSAELLPLLLSTVEQQLLKQMYGTPIEDLNNDGGTK
jgi:hypothetical protein